ncbi:unnamed protein product [Ranitomeya imitator]|uniref:Ig-like domain-containing protein n=1 Tax=Ranitomeya imitator TaxID=111125 RepID=A0ABN9LVE8_9NEOB|nr:unnamed protein product [Ranitomeya imitator]
MVKKSTLCIKFWTLEDLEEDFNILFNGGVTDQKIIHGSRRVLTIRTDLWVDILVSSRLKLSSNGSLFAHVREGTPVWSTKKQLAKAPIDTGLYLGEMRNCRLELLQNHQTEIIEASGSGSPPLIAVALQDSAVVVSCSSDGWFPKPTIFWKKENGDLDPTDIETDTDMSELIRVKSRILLNGSSEGQVYCGLRHPVTGKETGLYVKVSEMRLKEKDVHIEQLKWEVEWRKVSTKKVICITFTGPDSPPKLPSHRTTQRGLAHHSIGFSESIFFDPLTAYVVSSSLRTDVTSQPVKLFKMSLKTLKGLTLSPAYLSLLLYVLAHRDHKYLVFLNDQGTHEPERIKRVGTLLDYENGRISFYDVDTFEPLYTFQAQFPHPVIPFYYIGPGISFLSVERESMDFRLLYDEPNSVDQAEKNLLALCQGQDEIEVYCQKFRKWSVLTQWNEGALAAIFRKGLSEALKDVMVGFPMPAGLNESMSLAIQIGRRLRERKSVHHLAVLPELKPEPMQCDRTLTRVERQEHRRQNGLCFYCGDSTHAISDCPKRTRRFARSATIGMVQSKFLLSVTLICSLSSYSVMAFVDSGAALNLMDLEYARRCGFVLEPLQCPIPLRGIDATPLAKNKPQYWTQLTMCMAPAHQEVIRFLVLHNLHDVVVLGLPWLQVHNPVLDWKSMSVSSWGCQGIHGDVPFLNISSSTPSEVPEFLSDYRDVFDEPKSDALPPHRDCDCAINLIPGSKFPKGRLFNLSVPEHAAMRSYVKESLEKGHIRPSSSPLGAGFFFVAKKDGSLRPCIDYRLLNNITV